MFQQTIQDVLDLTAAPPGEKEAMEAFAKILARFEPFEAAELIARTRDGAERHVITPGLPDAGPALLDALAAEHTLRFDTTADLATANVGIGAPWNSILVLHLSTEPERGSALVLAHRRAWSFAATPLARVRTLGNVVYRLIQRGAAGVAGQDPADAARTEIAGLRSRIASLEKEIEDLRLSRKKR